MAEKKINIEQVLNYLNHAFARASVKASSKIGSKAVRVNVNGKLEATTLYNYQVEFCYLVNEIQRGPGYITPKLIQDANDLISRLENENPIHST